MIKRKPIPHCKICGAFLVGGKGGYCPEQHDLPLSTVLKLCRERREEYPPGNELDKIDKQIRKLEERI